MTFASVAFGLISGFVGWMLTELFAKPFRKGLDLVAEARTAMVIYGNVQARYKSTSRDMTGPVYQVEISERAEKRL